VHGFTELEYETDENTAIDKDTGAAFDAGRLSLGFQGLLNELHRPQAQLYGASCKLSMDSSRMIAQKNMDQ
jgi:hypothetical protein